MRHETVVEIDRPQIDEMLRVYLAAKFGVHATPMHDVKLTVHKDKFVVRVIDPPPAPGSRVK